ncbi:hypothetical protein, conserved [Babesia ovata]|uniref:Uncharacterized protein n=1 Tax=Babesia ovata TaxID=189622 RepID=A0A2H6KBQ9_9APIC|nr:uncharacterized protein BOVATA_019180 [Babesia ovata]GBE60425.1 hypothetical protein, conserved [Babesia ovata]
MSYLRKDRVYVVSNFFAMTMAGFAAFMSSDFIRLLSFDTVGDESYWIFAYQMTMWCSTIAASLVKTPAAPSLMYCLRFNVFFLVAAGIGFFTQWFESISFHLVVIFWAYIAGMALVNAVVFASYHHSGSRGLMLGSMLSFATTYGVLELVKYWTWKHGDLGKYRNIVLAYLVLRLVMNCAAMSFLSSGAQETHFEQFDKAFELIKKNVMMEWLSGTLHERETQLALKEVTPHYVSPVAGVRYIFEDSNLTVVWLIFMALCLSCSIFTPHVGAANWDLSVFKMGHVDRAEHVGNLMGVIVAVMCKHSWLGAVGMGLLYVVHAGLALFLTVYVHSYRMSLRIPMEAMCVLTCINALLGSFLTVATFTHFFELAVNLKCNSEKETPELPQVCCRDDESSECLCSEQFCEEKCSRKKCAVDDSKKIRVYIPPNTEEMYTLWHPDHCLLCWIYRHNPDEVCNIPEGKRTNTERAKIDECESYLLRNCKVSLCGYCDMNVLLECVKIKCTCEEKCEIPLPNANMYKEDDDCQKELKEKENKEKEKKEKGQHETNTVSEVSPSQEQQTADQACPNEKKEKDKEDGEKQESPPKAKGDEENGKENSEESDEDTDEKPVRKELHEICLCSGKNISIVTTSSSEFIVKDTSCCETKAKDVAPKETDQECEPSGREFRLSSMRSYSCCHYDLKVMMRLKEPNSNFHLMQEPYPGKFDPIGCLVFNGSCMKKEEHKKSDQERREKGEKEKKRKCSVLDVDKDDESLNYACRDSVLSSITRVPCDKNAKGDNGLCACCKAAQVYAKNKKEENKSSETPSPKPEPQQPSPKKEEQEHPDCCHMKVQPTALPFHFKDIDLKRNSYVGALFFIILVFGTAKLIIAITFAALEVKYGLDLSSNFKVIQPFYEKSEDPLTYGIDTSLTNEQLMKHFEEQMEYVSPPKLASMVPLQRWMESPSFDSIYEDNVRVFSPKSEKHATAGESCVKNEDKDANNDSRGLDENDVLVSSGFGLPSINQLGNDEDAGIAVEEQEAHNLGSSKESGDAGSRMINGNRKGNDKSASEPHSKEGSVVSAEDDEENDVDVAPKSTGGAAVEQVVRSSVEAGESDRENKSDDEEEDLTLVGREKKVMEEVLEQYKWLCNDLEFAFVENWVQETTDLKNKEDADVDKIKRIRRVKWCLDSGLKMYSYQSADAITVYLKSTNEKWDVEMQHFQSGVTHKLKVVGDNVSMLSPMKMAKIGDHDWQTALTDAQITLWKEASADADNLARITKKDEQLTNVVDVARGVDIIVKTLDLWKYRVEVINELTNDGNVFLSWRPFLANWEQILKWEERFLPMYLKEYRGVKSLETDGAEAQK